MEDPNKYEFAKCNKVQIERREDLLSRGILKTYNNFLNNSLFINLKNEINKLALNVYDDDLVIKTIAFINDKIVSNDTNIPNYLIEELYDRLLILNNEYINIKIDVIFIGKYCTKNIYINDDKIHGLINTQDENKRVRLIKFPSKWGIDLYCNELNLINQTKRVPINYRLISIPGEITHLIRIRIK